MGDSYTIRCCRQATSHANAPHGPYVDKGRDVLRVQHEAEPAPCQVSMLLGPDGDHLVPGHRHIWQEADGALYDYRDQIPSIQEHSMAVRRLHFDGWPTVWIPTEVSVDTAASPELVGQMLTLELPARAAPGLRSTTSGSATRPPPTPRRRRQPRRIFVAPPVPSAAGVAGGSEWK